MMLPWSAMMRAAMGLGIGPSVFWEMSVREWRWLATSDDALDVPALRALMAKADMEDDNGTV